MCTKEEWQISRKAFSQTYHRLITDGDLNKVAEVDGDTIEEVEANAHLIVAAPQMYKALKGILLVAQPLGGSTYKFEQAYQGIFKVLGKRLETAVEALAKAEGKEK